MVTSLEILKKIRRKGPGRENSRKYLPSGEKIAKVGTVDTVIALLIVKKIKTNKCVAKPNV